MCIRDSPQTEHEPDSFYGKEFYLDPEFGMNQSEDCLYLNIWTPANTVDEKLPVAFWIHGGAFMHGFSHESEFDGAAYCERGVILVTINYRLGAFGFLAHPWPVSYTHLDVYKRQVQPVFPTDISDICGECWRREFPRKRSGESRTGAMKAWPFRFCCRRSFPPHLSVTAMPPHSN